MFFQPNSFGEICFLEESYEKMQKLSTFEHFESTLYSESGSMPLTKKPEKKKKKKKKKKKTQILFTHKIHFTTTTVAG